jgi:putative protease
LDRLAADPSAYRPEADWLAAIQVLQDPERELGFGFLYKEQVY